MYPARRIPARGPDHHRVPQWRPSENTRKTNDFSKAPGGIPGRPSSPSGALNFTVLRKCMKTQGESTILVQCTQSRLAIFGAMLKIHENNVFSWFRRALERLPEYTMYYWKTQLFSCYMGFEALMWEVIENKKFKWIPASHEID